MYSGCNSCKYLDEKSKQPGRTSGCLYVCQKRGIVNAAKDSCDEYEEALNRNTTTKNEIYHNSEKYNDSVPTDGCNSCYYLDVKKRAPGKASGAVYYCEKKGTYVNGAKDRCENYKTGFLTTQEKNKVYSDGENYSDDNSSIDGYLILLVFLIIIGILCKIFF